MSIVQDATIKQAPQRLRAGSCTFNASIPRNSRMQCVTTVWPRKNFAVPQGQKWQIGFEAACEVASVARSSRNALMCVSKHRSQRGRSVRGGDLPFLVGHPGLEPGANGLRTQLLRMKNPLYLTIPRTMYGQKRPPNVPKRPISDTVSRMKRALGRCPTSIGLPPHCFIG